MVRRVLGLVYREVSGIHQAAFILAFFAFASQLLALVRDRALASQFGAGATLDIYYAAFRIPDLLFVLFASTLSVYVLLPFVTARVTNHRVAAARALLGQVMSAFLLGYSLLAIFLAWWAPTILGWLFPTIPEQELLVTIMRVLLIQPFLLGLSSLCGVVTQYHSRFILHAISPLMYNVGIIIGIVALYPLWGLPGVAFGVVIGALGHLAVQLPLLRRSELMFLPARQIDWKTLRQILRVSIPRALTLSLNQVTLLALVSLGSAMAVGSVAVFQFAFNLQSVPLAIVGVSYSVAAFPTLAKLYAGKELVRFQAQVISAMRHIIFWSVPIIGLCIVLRAQLIRVILGAGAFDWDDTRLTAAVFALLVLSLAAHGINLLLLRALYAGGDTRTPLIISAVTTAVTIGVAYWLYALYRSQLALQEWLAGILRIEDVTGTEVVVLALAYTLGIWIQTFAYIWLCRHRFALALTEPARVSGQALVAAVVGGLTAYIALNFFVEGLNINTFIGIFLQGALAGILGLVAVVLTYALMRSPELWEVVTTLKRKIRPADLRS